MTGNEDDTLLEYGAQWIHGQEGNPLYDFCLHKGLLPDDINDDVGDERTGKYMTEDGEEIPSHLVSYVFDRLDAAKDDTQRVEANGCESVGSLLRKEFQLLFREMEENPNAQMPQVQVTLKQPDLMRALCNWFTVFEIIDNACPNLDKLSIRGYSDWIDCPGIRLVNLKKGYSSVIDELISVLPPKTLKTNTIVQGIDYTNCQLGQQHETDAKVTIRTNNGDLTVDHVILTTSIGVLKSNAITFNPSLPDVRQQLFDAHGYGTINKIFLTFDEAFWQTNGRRQEFFALKLVWKRKDHVDFPEWVYDMTGFDSVREQSNMLMGWIGGRGAELIEKETDEEIGRICSLLISRFLGIKVPSPIKTQMTRWFSNPYFRGAYSHPTVDSDQLERYRQMTFEPLRDGKGIPRVLFAGEATDQEFYSSTHGAFRSGLKVAEGLLKIINDVYS